MMMTQAYYGSPDEDHFHRHHHRGLSVGGYYDRAGPYSAYYDHRHDLRAEFAGRQTSHPLVHDLDPDAQGGSARRRIALACSRCRRRKIKCTGDPGDGTGCQSCRNSSTDPSACHFVRVGSSLMPLSTGANTESIASSASVGSVSQEQDGTLPVDNTRPGRHAKHQLPYLQTRSTFTGDWEQYDQSPVDGYSYSASVSRQDSLAGSYPGDNSRSWTLTTPISDPATALYYDNSTGPYSFNCGPATGLPPSNIHTPVSAARLPGVASNEMFSPLNMASLHSSLPVQNAQERRLPAPYVPQLPPTPFSSVDVPEIRPLGAFSEPRVHINGIHSRNAMPWSPDNTTRCDIANTMPLATGPPPAAAQMTPATMQEAVVLGYQFSHNDSTGTSTATPNSPRPSPSSIPATGSFQSTASSNSSEASMHPTSRCVVYQNTADERQPSSRESQMTSLYSFSSDTSDRMPRSSAPGDRMVSVHCYTPLRQPQAMHASSVEALRRQSSFESYERSTGHRVSMTSLNGRY